MEKLIKLVKSGKFNSVRQLLIQLKEKQGPAETIKLINEIDYLERRNGGSKYTALSWAARLNYIDIVKLLVVYGADPRQRNHHDQTVADVARIFKNYEVAKFLDSQVEEDISAIKRSDRTLKIKFECKNCEKLSVADLKTYLSGNDEIKKIAAEKQLSMLAKNSDSEAKHALVSFYESQVKQCEQARDKLLANPTLDNKKLAHFYQLAAIKHMEFAAELGSLNSRERLKKYAFELEKDLDEKQQPTYSRVTHSDLSNGQQVSIALAKSIIQQLDAKDDVNSLLKKPVDVKTQQVSEWPQPSAPPLDESAATFELNPLPEGHTPPKSAASPALFFSRPAAVGGYQPLSPAKASLNIKTS